MKPTKKVKMLYEGDRYCIVKADKDEQGAFYHPKFKCYCKLYDKLGQIN